ncbi:hypothetical protein BD770DRAFT_449502 [Pilaira anomala]|nr:hypothetical protein BD770DRAFT_449502 [Pilaira anomala]
MSRQTDIFRYCNVTAPTGRNRQVRSHLRLTEDQKADVRTFRAFNNEIANGHCTLCMRVLYPEEQHYRSLTQEWIICDSWNNVNPIKTMQQLYLQVNKNKDMLYSFQLM